MNMSKTSISFATAAAILALSGLATATPAAADDVKCYGVNSCKGTSDCKTAKNACKGQNACKGMGFKKESSEQCTKDGGSTTEPK